MIEVGTKDKIFVALALPLAVFAGFVFFVRSPAVKTRTALTEERQRLPDPDLFPIERRNLANRVTETEKELAAARARKPVAAAVTGDAAASVADRQDAVFAALSQQGVRLVRVAAGEGTDPGVAGEVDRAARALRETGVRPEPVERRFVVEAAYPDFVAALEAFVSMRAPVVPAAVSMTTQGRVCRWEFTLWL